MYLDLNGCTELELMSYKIILLSQINSNKDVLKKIDKELNKLHKINALDLLKSFEKNKKKKEENAQTKN